MTRSALAFKDWYLPWTNALAVLVLLLISMVAADAEAPSSFVTNFSCRFFSTELLLELSYVRDVVGTIDVSFSRISVTILPNNVDCCMDEDGPLLPLLLELRLFFCFLSCLVRSSLFLILLAFLDGVSVSFLWGITDTPLPTKVAVIVPPDKGGVDLLVLVVL